MAGQPYITAWPWISWHHKLHKQLFREFSADFVHYSAAASTCHTRRDPGLGSFERKGPLPPELVSCLLAFSMLPAPHRGLWQMLGTALCCRWIWVGVAILWGYWGGFNVVVTVALAFLKRE